ncbi:hypothetical protein N8I77_008401 [Diaporthe amygdali]|uniref:C2H2-type domain-containing protein n=1 Tax=Phomopsis amygdali TaxID=1214568 RepID=A0AAD9W4F1_PHOAM|nr:hypothetical protein N8I77_008401 [Diaporthe amygdali]
MMAAPSSEDIRLKSIACEEALLALVAGAKRQFPSGLIDLREIQNHHERFTQWAGNLGAFHNPESRLSLEYRLRNSPQIRDAILRLLADLCDSTRDALDIVSGKQENRTALPLIDLKLDFGEFDLSSGSESSYASSSGKKAPAASSASEIDELTSAIKGSINSLFKTSIFIRNFAPKQRRQKAAEKTDSFVSQTDEMYIKDRYPLVEQRGRADLVTRLGLANALRRQYFLYCREHNDRLSKTDSAKNRKEIKDEFRNQDPKQRTASTSGQTYTSIIAQTEATELPADNLAHSHISTFLDTEPAPSLISLATTIIKSPEDDIAFPPLPSDAQNNLIFLCPYCLRVVKIKPQDREQQWRKHVLSDLEPYVCTFPGCGLDTFQSQHAWFDHEILVHRGTWRCSQCGEIAGTAEVLENHIKKTHADQISPPQIPAVIEQSRRPIKFIQPAECPFCEGEWAAAAPNPEVAGSVELVVTLDDFRRHLGHHLQRIALFSLPRLRQDRETSSSAVVGGTMDRSLSSVAALSLGDQIVESLVVSTFPPGSHHVYMPEGHLDQLVTTQSIIWEFTGAPDVDFEGQNWAHVGEELIEYILMSAKKVFAISLICGVESSRLRKAMNTFKFTGFNDSNLPIQATKSTEVPWSLLQWPVVMTQKFEQRQWMFLVPIFHTKFLRMELEPHEILPFALIKNERSQDSAEDLWEVSIHESHCEAPIRKVI